MHPWLTTALSSTNTRQNTKGGLGDQAASITLSGDVVKARALIPMAHALLGMVANQMNLSGVHYATRAVTMPDGSVIQVVRNYTLNTIRIGVPLTTGGTSEETTVFGGFTVYPGDVNHSWEKVFIRTVFNWRAIQPYPTTNPNTKLDTGSVSWFGRIIYNANRDYHEVALTWDHGLPCRYRLAPTEDLECGGRFLRMDETGEPMFANSGYPYLYFQGVTIHTPHNVVGAAILDNRLIYVSYVDLNFVDDPSATAVQNDIANANANAKVATFFISTPISATSNKALPALTWTTVGRVVAETSTFKGPWFFSPTGDKASTVLEGYVGQNYIHDVTIGVFENGTSFSLFDNSTELNFEPPRAVLAIEPEITVAADTGSYTTGEWLAVRAYPYQTIMSFGDMLPLITDEITAKVNHEKARCPLKDPQPSFNTAQLANTFGAYENGVLSLTMIPSIPWQPAGGASINLTTGVTLAKQIHQKGSCFSGGFVDNQCVPIEGDLISFGFFAERETYANKPSTTTTKLYESEFYGDRIVAIDYGFDGTRLEVTQKLTENLYKYTYETSTRDFFNGIPGIYNFYEKFTGITQSGDRDDYISKFEIGAEWVFAVNDEPLVTAFGGIDTDDRTYKRLYSTRHYSQSDNLVSSVVDDYVYEETAEKVPVRTERVWLLDADARSMSAIYNKQVATAKTQPILDAIVPDGVWRTYAMYALSVVSLIEHVKEAYIAIVHHGKEIERRVVPIGNNYPVMYDLRNRGAPLHVLPRMFSFNDVNENDIPDTMHWDYDVQWYDPETWRSWTVTPIDYYPTQRLGGSLAVRRASYAMASVNDQSIIGVSGDGMGPMQNRPTENINRAMFDGVSYDVEQQVQDALSTEELPVVFGDELNFRPIHVV